MEWQQRELKFRVWEIDSKSWRGMSNVLLGSGGLKWWQFGETVDIISDQKNYTITQYTGLKDKEGNEIYEGDYIRATFGAHTHAEPVWVGGGMSEDEVVDLPEIIVTGEVRYRPSSGFGFLIRGGSLDGRFFNFKKSKPVKIIGNVFQGIHENKELLKEEVNE